MVDRCIFEEVCLVLVIISIFSIALFSINFEPSSEKEFATDKHQTLYTDFFEFIQDLIAPLISFVPPTRNDGNVTTDRDIGVNISIDEGYLDRVIYNWNGTNYTVYDDSLILAYNFDNVSALGENYKTFSSTYNSTNIALDKLLGYSSQYDTVNWPATNIDNGLKTGGDTYGWATVGGGIPGWISFDFGSVKNIGKVAYWTESSDAYGVRNARNYTLQSSSDGTTWTNIVSGELPSLLSSGTINANITFPSVSTRYFRFYGSTSYDATYITSSEIEVFEAFYNNVADISSYHNDGVFYNSSWNSSGKYGGALMFDGVDDYMNINSAGLNSFYSNLSLSVWVYVKGGTFIVDFGEDTGTKRFTLMPNGFQVQGICTNIGTSAITNNVWHHVVGTFGKNDLSGIKLYVDGNLVNSSNCSNTNLNLTSPAGKIIGSRYNIASGFFNGSIDEVRIWNKSLSASEISMLYNSNLKKYDNDSYVFYVNNTNLSVGTYTYQGFSYDDFGNFNATEGRNVTIAVADNVPPIFVSIPANVSINYSQNVGASFNATDETAFGNYYVNDSRFAINSTGWLSNATGLAAGVYELNVSITDVAGNLNWTRYKVTVNKIVPTASLGIDTTWIKEYNGANTSLWVVESNFGDSDVVYVLWRNNVNVGSTDSVNAIGVYNYKINTTGGENYSAVANLDSDTLRIEDTTAPSYSLNSTNNTDGGRATLFSLLVNDVGGLGSAGQYVFSTNNSGVWVNDSAVNFSLTPQWANVTKILNDSAGNIVCYRWYLTDNVGNEIVTPQYCLEVTSAVVGISISLSSELVLPIGWTFTTLPVFNQSAPGNNGIGITDYFVNISAEGGSVDLYVKGNSDLMTSGLDVLGIGNETYSYSSTDHFVPDYNKWSLSTNYSDGLIGDGLTNGAVVYLKFFLNAPSGQAAGSYNNSLMFKAVPHGETP